MMDRPPVALWTPETVTATPLTVVCARCGNPLTLPAGLASPGAAGARLVHDVCPDDQRASRRYEVRLQVVDVTATYAAAVLDALVRWSARTWEWGVVEEELAGFRVAVEATTLQGAIEAAADGLSTRWTQLHEKAPLADGDE